MRSRDPVSARNTRDRRTRQRGSVLVIVLVTLAFTTLALVAFMEKASTDLLVEARDATAARLRMEAYSALETTLAVLEDFRAVGRGLHNPSEGWADPLGFADWKPKDGVTVEVSFEDESGKISLPRVDALTLKNLFEAWEIPANDAENLADALMGWMKRDHLYATALTPDYDRAVLPYTEPGRPLRSFDELAAIELARDVFYKDGKPNELWHRFASSVSLFNFQRSNINAANADVLASHGQFDEVQRRLLGEYLSGTGAYQIQGPNWFTNMGAVRAVTGVAGNPNGFGTTISALRINLLVKEGLSVYRLSAVVAPVQGGATTVQTTATDSRNNAPANATQGLANPGRPSNLPTASANPRAASNAKRINYPFTLLEIRENDEIVQAPPPAVVAP